MKKRIVMMVGTRPEAIKMCPLYIELKKSDSFETFLVATGQHESMLQQVLDVFGVKADYNLKIMKKGQTLFDINRAVLENLPPLLEEIKPDVVLVHGDTSTAFASALAAFYLQIPVGHVEAGLRTGDIYQPFPEEFNREAISLVSRFNFCPTPLSMENLVREGKKPETMIVTGNTGIDSLRYTVKEDYQSNVLDWLGDSQMILMTAHRRENYEAFPDMFDGILKALNEHPNCKLVYPAHPSPVVQKAAHDAFDGHPNVLIIEPLDVFDFHNLIARSHLILTDSGGIQEEAPYFGIPVLVMRNVTERPEGVEAGTLKLVGNRGSTIYAAINELLNPDCPTYSSMSGSKNPFGDGHASERIVANLTEKLV
ncbi:MAG: UDP-N-acetylglucosamine 2-epimerase (non-hydrolyzing) [Bacilli bacterium]|nr:UDP-N-acetylglucosamine 2-epimerase (non-hydrolyzing) [Bacilli bacterium]